MQDECSYDQLLMLRRLQLEQLVGLKLLEQELVAKVGDGLRAGVLAAVCQQRLTAS